MEISTLYKKVIERVKPQTEDEAADIYADLYSSLRNGKSRATVPPHTEAALKYARPETREETSAQTAVMVPRPEVPKREKREVPKAKPAPEVREPAPENTKVIYRTDAETGTKVCPKCKVSRSREDDFYKYIDSKGKLRYAGYCKECDKKRQSERKKKNDSGKPSSSSNFSELDACSTETPSVDGKRVCNDCGLSKSTDEFYQRVREGKPMLYSCYCKECARKRTKASKMKRKAAHAASLARARNTTVKEGIVEYLDGVSSKLRQKIKNMYWAKGMTPEEISFSLDGMNVEKIKNVLFSQTVST